MTPTMKPVVEVVSLSKVYKTRGKRRFDEDTEDRKEIRAVDDVDLTIHEGETVALVGQSGSGKTTTGRLIARLEVPTSGAIRLDGKDLASFSSRQLRRERTSLQMVFQDPYDSLNPRYTVGRSVEEPLRALSKEDADERRSLVISALDQVGLTPGAAFAGRYPHELSGGQRQRVAIARAIVLRPRFIVADEPVSMLDVSIRAGVLELLKTIQQEMKVALLLITHDLAVAHYMADRIAVMFAGRLVEVGPSRDVASNPRHPYTRLLLASIPRLDRTRDTPEQPSMPGAPLTGCQFAPSCPMATDLCVAEAPPVREVNPGHTSACHYA